jgi:hypothetical protein
VSIKLHAFDNELVALLLANGHDRNPGVVLVDAVEAPEIAKPEFAAGKWVRPERLDGLTGDCRLVLESSDNTIADESPFPRRKPQELGLGLPSHCDTIKHGAPISGARRLVIDSGAGLVITATRPF